MHIYLGQADPYFTLADEARGYAETRRHLAGYSDADLLKTYAESVRDSFNQLFGHNARKFGNLVVDELHARGIYQAPNIFGPIKITWFERI